MSQVDPKIASAAKESKYHGRSSSPSSSSESPSSSDSGIASGSEGSKHKGKGKVKVKKVFQSFGLERADIKDPEGEERVDDVLEVWFAGCHSGMLHLLIARIIQLTNRGSILRQMSGEELSGMMRPNR